MFLQIAFFSCALLFASTHGQIGKTCGASLEDIPNAASDSCTAFYRCYQFNAYSMRCPAGQAFHYDRKRCRPANEVDCPLQLQRFQAPGVPSYLRRQEEPEISIRVIQIPTNQGQGGLAFSSDGGVPVSVSREFLPAVQSQQQSLVRVSPHNPYIRQNIAQQPFFSNVQGQGNVGQDQAPLRGQGVIQTQSQSPFPNLNGYQSQANVPRGQYGGQGQFQTWNPSQVQVHSQSNPGLNVGTTQTVRNPANIPIFVPNAEQLVQQQQQQQQPVKQ